MTKTSVQNISDPPKPENVGDTLPLTTQPKTIQKNDKLSLKRCARRPPLQILLRCCGKIWAVRGDLTDTRR